MLKTWPQTARMPAQQWNGYVEELTAVRKGYSELRLPWRGPGSAADKAWTWYGGPDFAVDATDEIARTVQLLIDAQCLRQRLDEALTAEGGTPITPGSTAHAPEDGLGILGTIALVGGAVAIGGGAIWIATHIAKKRRSAA